mmetsp:Transcript_40612/g.117420  ORF Transcript_40612/g.117420 Transcript_40612/m.117420 type:complete len:1063 (-) Transcript_40612:163-3351(-)
MADVVIDAYEDPTDVVPPWGSFLFMRIVWPLATQVLLTVIFICIRRAYLAAYKTKTFHRFIHTYVGQVDDPHLHSPIPMVCLQLLQIGFSLAAVVLYAKRSYEPHLGLSQSDIDMDYGFTGLFIFFYFIERLQEGFQWHTAWRFGAIVDVLTIMPILLPYDNDLELVPTQQRWLTLGFLRMYKVLGAYTVCELLLDTRFFSDLGMRLVLGVVRTLALVISMAGVIFVLEVLGEIPGLVPNKVRTDMGNLSFMQMCYWMITTISTVGYGDYAPKTVPSQIMIICFIFVGVIFFGTETTDIANLKWSMEQGRGMYNPTGDQHIVVVGPGVSKMSSMLQTFFFEVMNPGSTKDMPDIVLLSEGEYDEELVSFIKGTLPIFARKRIHLMRGSAFFRDDLDRVHLGDCRMAMVLPVLGQRNSMAQDNENTLRALEMQRLYPNLRVRLMLLETSSEDIAVTLGVPRQRCFTVHGLKAHIFALSARVKGIPTLIAGLIEVTSAEEVFQNFGQGKEPAEPWQIPYAKSVSNSVHGMSVGEKLANKKFWEAAAEVYDASRGIVALVAAQIDGELKLNPDTRLHRGQVVMIIAPSPEDAWPFALEGEAAGEGFPDWRRSFTQLRADMLREGGDDVRFAHHGRLKIDVRTGGESATLDAVFGSNTLVRSKSAAQGLLAQQRAVIKPIEAADPRDAFAELKSRSCLVMVIVLDNADSTWHQVESFISALRLDLLPTCQPFIVLSATVAPPALVKHYEGDTCAFVSGNVLDIGTLESAGAAVAESVVVFRGSVPADEETAESRSIIATLDYQVVTIAAMLRMISPKSNDRFEIYEFGSTQAVHMLECDVVVDEPRRSLSASGKHFNEIMKAERRTDNPKLLFAKSFSCLRPLVVRRRGETTYKKAMSKQLLMLRNFAGGKAFSQDFFGGLLGRMFSFPATIEFVEAICLPMAGSGQDSFAWQVSLPPVWVGKTFGELSRAWILGGCGNDFVTDCGGVMILALYRMFDDPAAGAVIGRSRGSSAFGVSLTLPSADTVLEETDWVTVLATQSFARKAAVEGLLRGSIREDVTLGTSV